MIKTLKLLLIAAASLVLCCSTYAQSSSFREIRLFVDADKSLVDKAGSEAKANEFIIELVAKVDAIYRAQLGLTVTLAGTHLWREADPFVRGNLSLSLLSFAEYAESNYRTIYNYDVAHLLLGDGLGGEGGIAYQGSACGTPFTAPQAYGISQPDITDEYEFNAHLLAHEMGHNLNSEHDQFPACSQTTVMCPGQIGGTFSAQSISAIDAYVSERAISSCFPTVQRDNPLSKISLKVKNKDGKVNYKLSGSQDCTSLTLVASPSLLGLDKMFAYLQLGKLKPAATINAMSKNPLKLINPSQKNLYIGVYCNGQLASSKAILNVAKIKSKKATNSVVLALRSLRKGFVTS